MAAAEGSSDSQLYLDHVRDDVLIEILKTLPTKLLHRCKCVSKRWLNTISSDFFVRKYYNFHHRHLDQSNPAFALIVYQSNRDGFCIHDTNKGVDYFKLDLLLYDDMASEFSLDSLAPPPQSPPFDMFSVLSSDNGLVLCSTKPKAYTQRYFVCNPLSKMWLPIPRAPTADYKAHVGFLCKVPFSSINSTTRYYSFRIARLVDPDGIIKVEIYTSETGQWTEHILDNSNCLEYFEYGLVSNSRFITCKGLIYWDIYKALIVMDPYKCRFGGIKMPHFHRHRYSGIEHYFFGECKGKMRCVQYHKESLTIWELEDDDINASSWSLVQVIDLAFRYEGISSIIFHPFNEEALFLSVKNKIVFCNTTEETFHIIWKMGDSNSITSFPIVLPWWPLSKSHKPDTANTFEDLNSDYSSFSLENYSQSSLSDDANSSSSDHYSD